MSHVTGPSQRWNANPEIRGRGLGIVIGSFDPAPGLDVFGANDMTNNHDWSRAASDTGFRPAESALFNGLAADCRALARGSMGIATGDFDRDGDIDFYVTNFEHEYNTYHEQGARGLWQDQTLTQGLVHPTMPFVGFGIEAVDFDNNGQLELLVSDRILDSMGFNW